MGFTCELTAPEDCDEAKASIWATLMAVCVSVLVLSLMLRTFFLCSFTFHCGAPLSCTATPSYAICCLPVVLDCSCRTPSSLPSALGVPPLPPLHHGIVVPLTPPSSSAVVCLISLYRGARGGSCWLPEGLPTRRRTCISSLRGKRRLVRLPKYRRETDQRHTLLPMSFAFGMFLENFKCLHLNHVAIEYLFFVDSQQHASRSRRLYLAFVDTFLVFRAVAGQQGNASQARQIAMPFQT